MSTDYSAVCNGCHERIHLGQMGCGWSFGYGSGDVETAREQGEWLTRHVHHKGGVSVVCDDQLADEQWETLKHVELAGGRA
jgi:hypothetical protein